jgi:prepilin-type N-terminal cleavage/methylation domain-containing protein
MKRAVISRVNCLQRRILSVRRRSAFTLIEIMIVVAIIGLIAMIGVPAIYHAMHPESLHKGVSDFVDACGNARARSIWESAPVELRIHPLTGTFEIIDAPRDTAYVDPATAPLPVPAPNPTLAPHAGVPSNLSGHFSDHLRINLLDVNFREYKEADEARVRFYPNGTCDDCTIVLQSMDTGESRKITLDLVTATAEVSDFP